MNIAYDEIITKANARKDSLMAFEAACKKLHEQLVASAGLMNALYMVEQTAKKLDNEALALLPANAYQPLSNWVGSMLYAWRNISARSDYLKMTPSDALQAFVGE